MRPSRLTLASLVLVLMAAACGGDDDSGEALNADTFTSATTTRAQPQDSDEADTESGAATELEPLGSEATLPRFPWSETAPPRFSFCWDYQHAWERHDASLKAALAAVVDYAEAEAAARTATDELDRAAAREVTDDLLSRALELIQVWDPSSIGRGEAHDLLSLIQSVASSGVEHGPQVAAAEAPSAEDEVSAPQTTTPATAEPKTVEEVAYTRAFDDFSSVATTEELVLLTHFDDIFNYWVFGSGTSLGSQEWGTALGLFVGGDPLPKSPALEASVAIRPAVELFVSGTLSLEHGAFIVESPSIEGVPELEDAVDDLKAAAHVEGLPVDLLDSLADAVLAAAAVDRSQGEYPRYSSHMAILLYRVVAVESLTGSDAWRALHESLIESCRVT